MKSSDQDPDRRQPRTRWRDIESCVPVLKDAVAAVLADDENAYLRSAERVDHADIGPFVYLHLFIAITSVESLMNVGSLDPREVLVRIGGWQTFLTPRIDDGVLSAILERAANPTGQTPWPRIDGIEFLTRYMATGALAIAYSLHENPWDYGSWEMAYDDLVALTRKEFRSLSLRRYSGVKR
jgi:hypothetical protein